MSHLPALLVPHRQDDELKEFTRIFFATAEGEAIKCAMKEVANTWVEETI